MNKKKVLIAIGLLTISGVFFFFSGKNDHPSIEEKSDVVIVIERTPPEMKKKKMIRPEDSSDSTGIENPEVAEYKSELQEILNTLPTIEALQNLPEKEVHHIPRLVRESGEKIASAIAKADANPQLQQEAMNFLVGCAETADSSPSIRALCWKKIVQNIPRWKIFVPLTETDVPQDIKDLASKL